MRTGRLHHYWKVVEICLIKTDQQLGGDNESCCMYVLAALGDSHCNLKRLVIKNCLAIVFLILEFDSVS